MIRECLEIFTDNLKKYGESYILDNYVPKDGTYILVSMAEGQWRIQEPLDIVYNKRTGILEGRELPQYKDLSFLDYYSKLIDMNKPVDPKKIIHSNNYFTFFVKKESLADHKVSEEIIDGYYSILKNPWQKYKKANVARLYQEVEDNLGTVDENILNRIHQWILDNLQKLDVDLSRKDYLKLFFVFSDMEKTKKAYVREGKRYLLPNIYNNNDFNQVVEGTTVGVPNDNLGMNSKKPYLENHTRKVSVPYLLDQEAVLLQSQFYDFLMGYASKGNVNIYFDNIRHEILALKSGEHPANALCGYFLRLRKGKEVEIHDADTVVSYNPNLIPPFFYKEILKAERQDYGIINKRKNLEVLVDDVWFDKNLVINYFVSPEDMKIRDGIIFNQMVAVRKRLFTWFRKNNEIPIWLLLQETGTILIKNSVMKGRWKTAKYQLNLLWSLEDYFNRNNKKEEMMNQIAEQLWNHMNEKEEWECSSDQEYYFAVGQLVSYFISRSNSKKKPLSFVNSFLNAKTDAVIKKRLVVLFKKYNYDIEYKNMRVKRLFSNVMLYQPQNPCVNTEMLSAGVTANNFIFMKTDSSNDSKTSEQ